MPMIPCILLLVFWPASAMAHAGASLPMLHWTVLPLGLSLLLFIRGAWRSVHHLSFSRWLFFLAGWGLLTVALGPLDTLAERSVSGHMLQHMILLAAAPPLLLLARPLPVMLRSLPASIRRRLGPSFAHMYRASASNGLAAFLVHGGIIWFWHMPWAYQAAVESRLLHDLEHASFLLSGLWFWWTLIAPARLGQPGFGAACLWTVLTVMHTGMLGALLTFAPTLIYPNHPAGIAILTPLEDQQLAGLVMWVPGSMVYTFAAVALCLMWMGRPEPPPSTHLTGTPTTGAD